MIKKYNYVLTFIFDYGEEFKYPTPVLALCTPMVSSNVFTCKINFFEGYLNVNSKQLPIFLTFIKYFFNRDD